MVQVTDKDRIFVAIAIPVALVVLYVAFVHAPRAKVLSGMRSRLETLGDAEDLVLERPALERRRAAAAERRAEADTAEAARIADAGGEAGAKSGDSARLDRVVALFNGAEGVTLKAAERVERTDGGEPRAKALVGEALGIASPALWSFTVSADYASMRRVLAAAGERGIPAIVDGVSFDGASGRAGRGGARVWRIDVWL